jgi:MOSC domain-containing protein YiiM
VSTVASLHLHPETGGDPLRLVESIDVVEEKGIVGNGRYFGRIKKETGEPSRRQVSLIEREQIAAHAAALGCAIAPGAVRSNIETSGIDLVALVGKHVRIGSAELFVYETRDPCGKMDAIAPGLRERMMHGKQGVMARVTKSGSIRVGDSIEVLSD